MCCKAAGGGGCVWSLTQKSPFKSPCNTEDATKSEDQQTADMSTNQFDMSSIMENIFEHENEVTDDCKKKRRVSWGQKNLHSGPKSLSCSPALKESQYVKQDFTQTGDQSAGYVYVEELTLELSDSDPEPSISKKPAAECLESVHQLVEIKVDKAVTVEKTNGNLKTPNGGLSESVMNSLEDDIFDSSLQSAKKETVARSFHR